MDGLGWDGSEIVGNSLPLWNSQRNDIEQSFLMSNSGKTIIYGGKMDLLYNPIQELQKAHANLDLDMVPRSIFSELDSVNEATSNVLQRQGIAADTSLLTCANWGDAYAPSSIANRANGLSASNASTCDIDVVVQSQVTKGSSGKAVAAAAATVTGSFESLDCLISATISNTDTSDEISMIVSECNKAWNFGAVSAVSSGESGSNTNTITVSKDFSCALNELEETVSQSSSDGKLSRSCSKRSIDQSEFNFNLSPGFRLIPPRTKKPRSEKRPTPTSSNINFQQPTSSASSSIEEPDPEAVAQMKEMIYRAAAFRPVNLGLEVVEKPKRKNVRISTDPQTVAARQRRERISERIRVLQRLVPGGSKMDTASMLDEAANYLKFLRSQVKALENLGPITCPPPHLAFSHSLPNPMQAHFPLLNPSSIRHPGS